MQPCRSLGIDGDRRQFLEVGSWYRSLRSCHFSPELGNDLNGLAVADDIAEPILKSIVTDTKAVIAALYAFEQQRTVLRRLTNGDIINKDL